MNKTCALRMEGSFHSPFLSDQGSHIKLTMKYKRLPIASVMIVNALNIKRILKPASQCNDTRVENRTKATAIA